MKTKDFIQAWVTDTDPDTTMVITEGQETTQDVHITTTGTSTIKRCYGWSCNERCLFYHDKPVCYKTHGILICLEDAIDIFRKPAKELNLHCYTFDGNFQEFQNVVKQALHRFYDCAMNANWLDDVILQFASSLNCKYENKYLEHCRKLAPDVFREVSKKHVARLTKPAEKAKVLNGLWYR